jgi:hypothetical protein
VQPRRDYGDARASTALRDHEVVNHRDLRREPCPLKTGTHVPGPVVPLNSAMPRSSQRSVPRGGSWVVSASLGRRGCVLLNHAGRDTPALPNRDGVVFRPGPDIAAALAACRRTTRAAGLAPPGIPSRCSRLPQGAYPIRSRRLISARRCIWPGRLRGSARVRRS